MKKQNNNLDFTKKTITELNENQLSDVNGGSSPGCVSIFIASVALSHQITQTFIKIKFK